MVLAGHEEDLNALNDLNAAERAETQVQENAIEDSNGHLSKQRSNEVGQACWENKSDGKCEKGQQQQRQIPRRL